MSVLLLSLHLGRNQLAGVPCLASTADNSGDLCSFGFSFYGSLPSSFRRRGETTHPSAKNRRELYIVHRYRTVIDIGWWFCVN